MSSEQFMHSFGAIHCIILGYKNYDVVDPKKYFLFIYLFIIIIILLLLFFILREKNV